MVRLRLLRIGKRNQPYFRIVAADKRAPIQGRYIEQVGFLNPRTKEVDLIKDRIKHWLSNGAVPTPRVFNLLVDNNIIKQGKIKATRNRVGKKKSEEESKEGFEEKKFQSDKSDKKEEKTKQENNNQEKPAEKAEKEEKTEKKEQAKDKSDKKK